MIENNWHKKEQPLFSMSGLGGGSFREVLSALVQAGFRSLRFNSGDSAYLNKTFAAGNRRTWTWSGWVKRVKELENINLLWTTRNSGEINGGITVGSDNKIQISAINEGVAVTTNVRSTALFRDPSAWFHLVICFNSTESTSTDRVKFYVNGARIDDFSETTFPSLNYEGGINRNVTHYIGRNNTNYSNAYLADVNFLDGIAASPTAFGAYDSYGVWQRSEYDGSYGTNGFKLTFADTTIGKDGSGQGNDLTSNNITVTDVLLDFPSNDTENTDSGAGGEVSGNYATMNPLQVKELTLSNGNLDIAASTGGYRSATGTIGISSGKYYWEYTITGGADNHIIGVTNPQPNLSTYIGEFDPGWGYRSNGSKTHGGSFTTGLTSAGVGDVIQVAVDMTAGKIWFGVNNTYVGSGNPGTGANAAYSNLSGTVVPAVSMNGTMNASINFGQRAFTYAAPSGYKTLNTTSLPTPTIADGSTAFDATLYTGNGSSQTISGLSFSPDLVWAKNRSSGDNHGLTDTVRGATKWVLSNENLAELTYPQALTAFTSDGFSVGSDDNFNRNSSSFVAWAWDAGSSTVTNTDGSITTSVRANQTAGFSIVTGTGSSSAAKTCGHGLNAEPHFIVVKLRVTAGNGYNQDWQVYHKDLGNTKGLQLNLTNSVETTSSLWNNTSPTNSVFSIGASTRYDGNFVAYCFAPVAGYSAFGSYTGSGNNNGSFIFTGFAVKYLLIKCSSDSGQEWVIIDNVRSPFNVADDALYANSSDNEDTNSSRDVDLLSNGFKLRNGSSGATDFSGRTYIYAAFAEHPFQANGGLAR